MNLKSLIILGILSSLFSSCSFFDKLEQKSARINRYENVALGLAKENRLLKAHIDKLNYKISELKSKNSFLGLKLDKISGNKINRRIASMPVLVAKNDLVKDNVYNWSATDLLKVARLEFDKKNYVKAAQYYFSFYKKYPQDDRINDEYLFEAGISSFESKKYYDWSVNFFSKLVTNYPNSQYFRGAKLWRGLTFLKMGNSQKYFETVEEFRKKYRNTVEWNILSRNYEKMVHRYKQ